MFQCFIFINYYYYASQIRLFQLFYRYVQTFYKVLFNTNYTALGFKHVCQQSNSSDYSYFEQNAFSMVVIIFIVLIILIHSFFIFRKIIC